MLAEAFVLGVERVRDAGERHAEGAAQEVLIGDVGRDLAQAVHVVGEADQFCRDVAQALEGVHDHCRAADFAEGTDMRQAGGAVSGFEQDVAFFRGFDFALADGAQTFQDAFGFFKSPGAAFHGEVSVDIFCHGWVGIAENARFWKGFFWCREYDGPLKIVLCKDENHVYNQPHMLETSSISPRSLQAAHSKGETNMGSSCGSSACATKPAKPAAKPAGGKTTKKK